MPVSSVVQDTYAYYGSLASLGLGSLLNTNLLNFGGGEVQANFHDDDGVLDTGDNGSATVALNGGAQTPMTYIGAGWAATAVVLGIPIDPRPAMAFSVSGQIYVHFPNGLPLLSGGLIAFNIKGTNSFTLPSPMVVCFADGTHILTLRGEVPVETLQPGDLVLTADHGAQPLRWIGRRTVSVADQARHPALRPVRITRGALGDDLPRRGLKLSQQHRVLVRAGSGTPEVLVAARLLADAAMAGVEVMAPARPVVYHHLLFDRHEIVMAEGMAAESLYLGQQSLAALDCEARREVMALFPDLALQGRGAMDLARPVLRNADLRDLRRDGRLRLRGIGGAALWQDQWRITG